MIVLLGRRRSSSGSSREGTHHLDASLNDMISIGIMNEQKYLIMKFRNKLAHFLLVNSLDGLLNNATSVVLSVKQKVLVRDAKNNVID